MMDYVVGKSIQFSSILPHINEINSFF